MELPVYDSIRIKIQATEHLQGFACDAAKNFNLTRELACALHEVDEAAERAITLVTVCGRRRRRQVMQTGRPQRWRRRRRRNAQQQQQ